ncbi:hypothetical protein ADUPG1_006059, partial [Aduncisulcus paluster]
MLQPVPPSSKGQSRGSTGQNRGSMGHRSVKRPNLTTSGSVGSIKQKLTVDRIKKMHNQKQKEEEAIREKERLEKEAKARERAELVAKEERILQAARDQPKVNKLTVDRIKKMHNQKQKEEEAIREKERLEKEAKARERAELVAKEERILQAARDQPKVNVNDAPPKKLQSADSEYQQQLAEIQERISRTLYAYDKSNTKARLMEEQMAREQTVAAIEEETRLEALAKQSSSASTASIKGPKSSNPSALLMSEGISRDLSQLTVTKKEVTDLLDTGFGALSSHLAKKRISMLMKDHELLSQRRDLYLSLLEDWVVNEKKSTEEEQKLWMDDMTRVVSQLKSQREKQKERRKRRAGAASQNPSSALSRTKSHTSSTLSLVNGPSSSSSRPSTSASLASSPSSQTLSHHPSGEIDVILDMFKQLEKDREIRESSPNPLSQFSESADVDGNGVISPEELFATLLSLSDQGVIPQSALSLESYEKVLVPTTTRRDIEKMERTVQSVTDQLNESQHLWVHNKERLEKMREFFRWLMQQWELEDQEQQAFEEGILDAESGAHLSSDGVYDGSSKGSDSSSSARSIEEMKRKISSRLLSRSKSSGNSALVSKLQSQLQQQQNSTQQALRRVQLLLAAIIHVASHTTEDWETDLVSVVGERVAGLIIGATKSSKQRDDSSDIKRDDYSSGGISANLLMDDLIVNMAEISTQTDITHVDESSPPSIIKQSDTVGGVEQQGQIVYPVVNVSSGVGSSAPSNTVNNIGHGGVRSQGSIPTLMSPYGMGFGSDIVTDPAEPGRSLQEHLKQVEISLGQWKKKRDEFDSEDLGHVDEEGNTVFPPTPILPALDLSKVILMTQRPTQGFGVPETTHHQQSSLAPDKTQKGEESGTNSDGIQARLDKAEQENKDLRQGMYSLLLAVQSLQQGVRARDSEILLYKNALSSCDQTKERDIVVKQTIDVCKNVFLQGVEGKDDETEEFEEKQETSRDKSENIPSKSEGIIVKDSQDSVVKTQAQSPNTASNEQDITTLPPIVPKLEHIQSASSLSNESDKDISQRTSQTSRPTPSRDLTQDKDVSSVPILPNPLLCERVIEHVAQEVSSARQTWADENAKQLHRIEMQHQIRLNEALRKSVEEKAMLFQRLEALEHENASLKKLRQKKSSPSSSAPTVGDSKEGPKEGPKEGDVIIKRSDSINPPTHVEDGEDGKVDPDRLPSSSPNNEIDDTTIDEQEGQDGHMSGKDILIPSLATQLFLATAMDEADDNSRRDIISMREQNVQIAEAKIESMQRIIQQKSSKIAEIEKQVASIVSVMEEKEKELEEEKNRRDKLHKLEMDMREHAEKARELEYEKEKELTQEEMRMVEQEVEAREREIDLLEKALADLEGKNQELRDAILDLEKKAEEFEQLVPAETDDSAEKERKDLERQAVIKAREERQKRREKEREREEAAKKLREEEKKKR